MREEVLEGEHGAACVIKDLCMHCMSDMQVSYTVVVVEVSTNRSA